MRLVILGFALGVWLRQQQSMLPEVHAFERWQLTARLHRPHGNANPHGLSMRLSGPYSVA